MALLACKKYSGALNFTGISTILWLLNFDGELHILNASANYLAGVILLTVVSVSLFVPAGSYIAMSTGKAELFESRGRGS